jgi:TPR repeat protein
MKRHYLLIIALLGIFSNNMCAQQTLEEATDSIKNILANAKAGNDVAMNEVGGWYYRGRHVKQDYSEAIQWWAKAAKKGNVNAIGNMGLCYQTGNGIKADSVMAQKLYTTSIQKGNKSLFSSIQGQADKGTLFSIVYIATCYQHGVGAAKDVAKAQSYFETGAQKGSVDAQRELGLLLLNTKQADKAYTWFKKAEERGDIPSTFYCGKQLLEGLGVQKDASQGVIYLLKAANSNFGNAQLLVGRSYYEGNGVTKNPEQGFMWIQRAACNGVTNAQYQLALCYVNGNGCNINFNDANYWFGRCLPKGHKNAFKKAFEKDGVLYGTTYHTYLLGQKAYAEKKFDEALKSFKEVEKAKVAEGKTMEGVVLANKEYNKYNLKKGIKVLTESAKTEPFAMYLLGGIYEAGKGVDKNMDTAVKYLKNGANNGSTEAMCYLGDMYYEGRDVEQNYDEAVKYYLLAKCQLTQSAAKHLAACYENGYGGLSVDKTASANLLSGDYKNTLPEVLSLVPNKD